MLRKFDLEDIPSRRTPITRVPIKQADNKTIDALILLTDYRSKVGSLIYPATITRPDIAFTALVAGRFSATPTRQHLDIAHGIIGYLKGVTTRGITYRAGGKLDLIGFYDADFSGYQDTIRSTTG